MTDELNGSCACGRPIKHTHTAECSACYQARLRREKITNPEAELCWCGNVIFVVKTGECSTCYRARKRGSARHPGWKGRLSYTFKESA